MLEKSEAQDSAPTFREDLRMYGPVICLFSVLSAIFLDALWLGIQRGKWIYDLAAVPLVGAIAMVVLSLLTIYTHGLRRRRQHAEARAFGNPRTTHPNDCADLPPIDEFIGVDRWPWWKIAIYALSPWFWLMALAIRQDGRNWSIEQALLVVATVGLFLVLYPALLKHLIRRWRSRRQ